MKPSDNYSLKIFNTFFGIKSDDNKLAESTLLSFGGRPLISRQGDIIKKLDTRNITLFGFALENTCVYLAGLGDIYIKKHMFFCFPPQSKGVFIGKGKGFLVLRRNFKGYFMMGGMVWDRPRFGLDAGKRFDILVPAFGYGDPALKLISLNQNERHSILPPTRLKYGIVLSGHGYLQQNQRVVPIKKHNAFRFLPGQNIKLVANSKKLTILVYSAFEKGILLNNFYSQV